MLTQCPSCQTTFRVTSEILRVAQGQVRCGRCQTQFDALERLIEEGPPGSTESGRFVRPPPHPPAPPPEEFLDIEVEEPEEQEQVTMEGRHIEISGTYRVMDASDLPGESHLRQEATEEWAAFDATDDVSVPIEQTPAADSHAERQSETVDEYTDLVSFNDPAVSASAAQALQYDPLFAQPRRLASRRRAAAQPVDTEEEPVEDFSMVTSSTRRLSRTQPGSLKWTLLAAPLVLALVAQVIHHFRSDLVRHPQVGPPLMNVYGALRLPLTPDWNLHAYEIKQWGVLSDPALPGTLKVRASITNRADFAQPYPLLKLVLEDRWGDQVRAREFEPAEYLDQGTAPDRLLGPRQQTNATINIVDPGPDAEGFRFDVCLVGRAGPVCAADVPE